MTTFADALRDHDVRAQSDADPTPDETGFVYARFIPENLMSNDARDHDEGYGCALGHEEARDGTMWLVCYAHDVSPVQIVEPFAW